MYSKSEQASFAALLADARANNVLPDHYLRDVLGEELFAEYEARWTQIYEQEASEVEVVEADRSPSLEVFVGYVNTSRRQFDSMEKRLPKLLVQEEVLLSRIKSHQDFLATAKVSALERWNELSDEDKLWAAPGTEEDGWPPKVFDEPPAKVRFAKLGKHTPYARALVRVLTKALGTAQ
ncbi:hypothetical protein [Erythrobacter sp. R86502]|uniref:hypothetical protein n=1 Tax=Erythrobacter sp. R86502 TaxID=3093846 RepID=UPI0036D33747